MSTPRVQPRHVVVDRIVVHGASVDRHSLAGLPRLIAQAIRSPHALPETNTGEMIAAAVARRVGGAQAGGAEGGAT